MEKILTLLPKAPPSKGSMLRSFPNYSFLDITTSPGEREHDTAEKTWEQRVGHLNKVPPGIK